MRILHTADIHLKNYDDERWNALRNLLKIGKKEKIDILTISGDLFDKNVNAESLRDKIRTLFSHNGFKIVIIPGNHDIESYRNEYYFGEDVIIIKDLNTPFEYEDIIIWGLPFEEMESENILLKLRSIKNHLNPEKKNLLLFHGDLLDAFFSKNDSGNEGDERYMPIKLSFFKELNFDYILAGHFHSKFYIDRLENGGYFIYPGTPVSLSKKEIGQRKVNIFNVGEPPNKYSLSNPYFEEVIIELDPFKDSKPIDTISETIKKYPSEAKIILSIKGYINSKEIGMSESDFMIQIEKNFKKRCILELIEFKDVRIILEDNIFKRFMHKLEKSENDEKKRKQMIDLTIRAIMEENQ